MPVGPATELRTVCGPLIDEDAGIRPESPPYAPDGRGEYRICFLADPDGYRIELIDGPFPTPQDPPRH